MGRSDIRQSEELETWREAQCHSGSKDGQRHTQEHVHQCSSLACTMG